MNLMEFKSKLETLGLPVQYQAFVAGHVPELPYILFYEDDSDNFFADNSNYFDSLNVVCELYSDEKDIELETKVQKLFYDNEIEYNSQQTFIDSENMYLKAYSVSIIFDSLSLADVQVKEIDKTKLQMLVNYSETLNSDLYEIDSFSKLQTVVAYAKAILVDSDALQDEVDESEDELLKALNSLTLIVVQIDKTALKQQIDYAQNLSANSYTQETWVLLAFALSDAKKVYDDENAKQINVNSALTSLYKAINNLTKPENGYEKGRNLYAPLYWQAQGFEGGIDTITGEINSYDYTHSNFIEIPVTATFTVFKTDGSDTYDIMYYTKDKEYINYKFLYNTADAKKIDMPRTAKFMRIQTNKQTPSSLLINKTKIEWDSATDYTVAPEDIPYNNLTQI